MFLIKSGGMVVDSKIVFIAALLLLLFPTTPVAAQPSLAEDWVTDALGYLNSFELYDYNTEINPNNRYQVSLALANTLQSLDMHDNPRIQRFGVSRGVTLSEIIHQYNLSVTEDEQLPEQYFITLAALATEYQDELDVLGYKIKPEPQLISLGALNPSGVSEGRNTRSGYFAETDEEKEYLLSSNLVPLWADFYLGAGLVVEDEKDYELNGADRQPSGYAGLIGEYFVNDDILFEGQYLHNLAQPFETGVLQLGATLRLGSVELGGLIKSPEGGGEKSGLTSFDFSYGDSESVSLNAGYQVDTNFKTIAELGNPARTNIDVGIPFSQGRLTLGVSQSWNQHDANHDGSNEPNEGDGEHGGMTSDESDDEESVASLGFSYKFSNEASVQFNYSLIDFSDIDTRAEFSIRF